jgi:hypothetical protein
VTPVVFKDGKPLLTGQGVALSQNCCCGSCCRYECIAPCCPVKLRVGISECGGGGTVDVPLTFEGCHAPFTISRPCDEGGGVVLAGRVRAVCERRRSDCGLACDYVVEFPELTESGEIVKWWPYPYPYGASQCDCGSVIESWDFVSANDSISVSHTLLSPCYGSDFGVAEDNSELNYVCSSQCQQDLAIGGEGWTQYPAPHGGSCSTYACAKCECPAGFQFTVNDYPLGGGFYGPATASLPITNVPDCCVDECQNTLGLCNWPDGVYDVVIGPFDSTVPATCDHDGLTLRVRISGGGGINSPNQATFDGWWRMPQPVNYGNTPAPLTLIRPPENCGCPPGWTIKVNGVELPALGPAAFVLPGLFDDHPECIDHETFESYISAVATTCDSDFVTVELNVAVPLWGCNVEAFDDFRVWFRMPYPGFSTNGSVEALLVAPPANAVSQNPGSVVQGSVLRLTNNSPEIVLDPSALLVALECPSVKNNLYQVSGPSGFALDPSSLEIKVTCPGCCCGGGDSYTDCVNGDGKWLTSPVCLTCRCCAHSGLLCFQTVYERMQYRAGRAPCCTRQYQYRVYDFETGEYTWGPTQEGTGCDPGITQADCENAEYYEDDQVRYFAGGVFSPACEPVGSGIDMASQPDGTFSVGPNQVGIGQCIDTTPSGGFGAGFVSRACSDGRFLSGCDQDEVQIRYTRVRIVQDCSECVDTGTLVPPDDNAFACQEPGVYGSVCRPINTAGGWDDLESLICPCPTAMALTGCGSENPFP